MVAQRADPPRATEEKPRSRPPQAAEAEAAPPKPAPTGAWKAWLPLGLAVVLMPLLAFGMTSFVLVPKMQKALVSAGLAPAETAKDSHSGEGAGEKGGATGGQRQNVTFNKLLVNVAGTLGSRYLLTSLTLMGKGADFPAKVAQSEPQLRDMACGILSTKTIVDLEKPGARNIIRGELLAGFNSILGNAVVQEIYFTEFSIQ